MLRCDDCTTPGPHLESVKKSKKAAQEQGWSRLYDRVSGRQFFRCPACREARRQRINAAPTSVACTVRLDSEVHRRLLVDAESRSLTVSAWIREAVTEKLS